MISPSERDRLTRLRDRAREWERRVFSNVAVTNDSGVRLLEVTPVPSAPGKSQVVIRDSSGNELLKNDVNAGWGLAAPQCGYPTYANATFMSTTGTSFLEAWLFAGFLYGPALEYGYFAAGDSGSTVECRLEYSVGTLAGPWTVVPGSTQQSTNDSGATSFTLRSGTFTVPLTNAGQFFGIRLMSRVVSGAGTTAYSQPMYLNQL
jgi:hypothetical protein